MARQSTFSIVTAAMSRQDRRTNTERTNSRRTRTRNRG